MTWFADLTQYRYGLSPSGWSHEGPPEGRPDSLYHWMSGGPDEYAFEGAELNVGWLDRQHDHARYLPDQQFEKELSAICATSRYMLTRGFHPCEFCKALVPALGSAEIRIQGDGVVYAAPNLVAHCVSTHHYAPPPDFVAGVLRAGGQQARPVPGTRRAIPDEFLRREDIDLDALRDAVIAKLQAETPDRFRNVELRASPGGVYFAATWRHPSGTHDSSRKWDIPRDALVSFSQSLVGVSSIAQARCIHEVEEMLWARRRPE